MSVASHLLPSNPSAKQLAFLCALAVFILTFFSYYYIGIQIKPTITTLFLGCVCFLLLMVVIAQNRQIFRIQKAEGEPTAILSATMEASPDAILVVNAQGIVLDSNSSSEALFCYTKSEALGRSMIDLFFPDDRIEPSMRTIRRFLLTGDIGILGNERIQLVARRKGGHTFPVEVSIGTFHGIDGPMYIAYLRDFSSQLTAETELMQARDKALDGEKAKSRFLAVMSHEMRTPLNGLLGTLDLLSQTSLTTKQEQYLSIAAKSGHLLLEHVNDVLDISKIEAGYAEAEKRPFNPMDIVDEVCDSQMSIARARGNALSAGDTGVDIGTVVGDPGAVRQILLNLVSNANKFTARGDIFVEAENLANNAGTIEFRVADTGIGIAPESLEDIFSDFVTLDPNFDREAEGTGLGLPIAKRLAEAIGGEIGVESEIGEGSLFWFRVPFARHMGVAESDTLSASPSDALMAPISPLNILLVEDNEINRLVAREMLEADGHIVTEAENGEVGAQRALSNGFDVVLMDISMPLLDGVSATQRIRASASPFSQTPILALTAHALPADIERFICAGMTDVVSKPIMRNELQSALKKAVASDNLSSLHVGQKTDSDPELPELINKEILSQLIEILGQTRVDELSKRFISEAKIAVKELIKIVDPQDVQASIPKVHRLAGSASTFGAQRLQETLFKLETNGKAGQNSHFLETLQSLTGILHASEKALSSALNE